MIVKVSVGEKDIKKEIQRIVYDVLQKDISMRWIRDVVEDEVRKQVKISVKVSRK